MKREGGRKKWWWQCGPGRVEVGCIEKVKERGKRGKREGGRGSEKIGKREERG